MLKRTPLILAASLLIIAACICRQAFAAAALQNCVVPAAFPDKPQEGRFVWSKCLSCRVFRLYYIGCNCFNSKLFQRLLSSRLL